MQTTITSLFKLGHTLLTNNKVLLQKHVQKAFYASKFSDKPSHWMEYNDKVYPPQGPDEERRPAFVCNESKNIKYSEKKMWYIATFIRGMTADEALKQLRLHRSKGGMIVAKVLEETMDMAVNDHNVEFRTNLWVAESFCTRGITLKGLRRHARGRITTIRYRHCNYYIKLEEGKPPKDYYCTQAQYKPAAQLERWMSLIRSRKIQNSL